VVELFEARKPKAAATLAELDGRVAILEGERGYTVTITPTGGEDGDAKEYAFPRRTRLRVTEGEVIEAGAPLNEGPLAPVEVLDLRDDTETARYLVGEVQEVYKSQGVEIHDKHIELIVRQMLKKVRIDNSGDSDYLPGELVDRPELEKTLRVLKAARKERPTHTQLILGITKASLATQSFLSAASFQETTKVLTDAALEGKTDHLVGLKENVIIGKLIPASTGLKEYRAVTIEPAEDAPRFYVEDFAEPPVYTDALVGGDGHLGANGDIDLTPKPGAEPPILPPVPDEE
jgi:DNA-directed RNA polymerase subunit beta'